MKRSDFWFAVFLWTMLLLMVAVFVVSTVSLFTEILLWRKILAFILTLITLVGVIVLIILIIVITYSDEED